MRARTRASTSLLVLSSLVISACSGTVTPGSALSPSASPSPAVGSASGGTSPSPSIDASPSTAPSRLGNLPGYGAVLAVLPQRGIVAVLLINDAEMIEAVHVRRLVSAAEP